ncbi:unnamed protein product [Fraxinus pennsylvanica]|uniref:FAE domain-containing protein n=1 Tax=Fraxinus pennsylvanica TaxID=56036 RepID=A0AAD2A8S9_9LAMI|nr:unnamed protein product [Fraxinus pennsylvanica]
MSKSNANIPLIPSTSSRMLPDFKQSVKLNPDLHIFAPRPLRSLGSSHIQPHIGDCVLGALGNALGRFLWRGQGWQIVLLRKVLSFKGKFLRNRDLVRKEAEAVMFGAIDELLAKTSLKPKDIGILIVNCSLFNPTPSLSAMVINFYKLRGNIISYNLGGMGCSVGLISIDLAKNLLQPPPPSLLLNTGPILQNLSYFSTFSALNYKERETWVALDFHGN